MRKWFTHPDGCTYLYQAIFPHILNPRVFFSGLRWATEPFRATITYTLRSLRAILARRPGARHSLCTGSQAGFRNQRVSEKCSGGFCAIQKARRIKAALEQLNETNVIQRDAAGGTARRDCRWTKTHRHRYRNGWARAAQRQYLQRSH